MFESLAVEVQTGLLEEKERTRLLNVVGPVGLRFATDIEGEARGNEVSLREGSVELMGGGEAERTSRLSTSC